MSERAGRAIRIAPALALYSRERTIFPMAKTKKQLIAGAVFVLIAGTLAHFVYDWSGQNRIVGWFFPVNESTWEHMKLIFFPMLLYSLVFGREMLCAMLWGTLAGTWLIPVLFYTYSGILGRNMFVLDLAVFVLSVLAGFWVAGRIGGVLPAGGKGQHADRGKELKLPGEKAGHWSGLCDGPYGTWLVCALTAGMILGFLFFTYDPPDLGIFAAPVSAAAVSGQFSAISAGRSLPSLLFRAD